MLKNEPKQLSLHSILYDKIPDNHILKKINSAVDFSFINELLKDSYCEYYGRRAKEPEMMCKLQMLERLYDLSDEQVIDDCKVNLAYMWFLGINPEDELPHPSLLSKFRKQRLKEATLDDIIKEIVRQCVDKGIIKGQGISVDSTHTEANTTKKVPERIMKHLAKRIMNSAEEEGILPESINEKIPNYKEIEDHNEAKKVMKEYLEDLIQTVENNEECANSEKVQKEINQAKEILESPKFIEQKGIRSIVDKDARVGYKSKTESFFGYKTEFAMIPEEKIITAVDVYDGAYVDGTGFVKLYNNTVDAGVEVNQAYGDKAYFRKPIIEFLEENGVAIYIPPSESVYRIDESKYSYNKDSDQWICEQGCYSVEKKKSNRKSRDSIYYYFAKEDCCNCPKRSECIKGNAKRKRFEVSISAPKFYEYSQLSKTEEFKEGYKKRACHENKNGEMKRFHGMDRARGYGLRSMRIQAKLTAIAVNLKRIVKLITPKPEFIFIIMGKSATCNLRIRMSLVAA